MALEEIKLPAVRRKSPALTKMKEQVAILKKRASAARAKAGLSDRWIWEAAAGGAAVMAIDVFLGDQIRETFGEWADYGVAVVAGVAGYAMFKYTKAGGSLKGVGVGMMAAGAMLLAKKFMSDDSGSSPSKPKPKGDNGGSYPVIGYSGGSVDPRRLLAFQDQPTKFQDDVIDVEAESINGFQRMDVDGEGLGGYRTSYGIRL